MVPTIPRRILATGVAAVLLAFGCKTTTEPPDPVATTITVTPATATLAALGATQQLTAVVKDQNGATMSGQTVAWSSGTASVATVDNTGLVTAASNGSATITASVGSANGTATVTVAQAVTAMAINAGDAQSAFAGTAVAIAPSVVVRDANGNPASGATVTFSVTQGGGSVTGGSATSDAGGIATVGSWILGPTVGANEMSANSGTAPSVGFTATGTVGPAAIVTANAGNGQVATVGTAVAVAPQALVTDANGNPVAGEIVTFTVTAGGGVTAVSAASAATDVTTDAAGLASVASWTLGTAAGTQTLEATVGALPAGVFTATGTADVAFIMSKNGGDNQNATAGTPVPIPPSVLIVDQYGNPVEGEAVLFAPGANSGSVQGSGPSTDANGIAQVGSWTLGAEGPNTLDVTSGALAPVTFNATATSTALPATIVINDGDGQDVLAGSEVIIPPSVLVKDFTDGPVAGATVNFAVTAGGGSVSGGTAITNAMGIATAGGWTYGNSAGTNEVTATVTGIAPATFSGQGVTAGYNIDLMILDPQPTAEVVTAFNNAKARWESIVVGDLVDIDRSGNPIAANSCGVNEPSFAGNIDDLMIWVKVEPIDGPGNILGQAGPCFGRAVGTSNQTTFIGIMKFDDADLADLVTAGTLEDVILHEMGHVLGIGTAWSNPFGFVQDPSVAADPDATPPVAQVVNDTYYNGHFGLVAFDRLGGASYTGGQIVPVENGGGPNGGGAGTINGHWRDEVFTNELMTGFISGAGNPLSLLTIASLADMALTTNPGGADAYTQVFTAQARIPADAIEMKNDIWNGPLYNVTSDGRIQRVR